MLRLKTIKSRPIAPKLLTLIVEDRAVKASEMAEIKRQIRLLQVEAQRVARTRADLEQIPSMVQPGGGLL
ncbi:MAG: hypothetical protein ACOYBO_10705 [Azonexus sp.]